MALSTLWIFGDSFDYGAESSVIGQPYYDNFTENRKPHYSLQLGKHLNSKVCNHAVPSFGPYQTLYYLSKNLKFIKPEDYIVVGMSDVHRLPGFEPNLFPKNTYGTDPYLENIVSNFGTWSRDDKLLKESMESIVPNFFEGIEKYVVNCIDPFKAEHTEFVNQLAKNIVESTSCSKSFIYNTTTWHEFESIKEATNNEIEDMHWSYKGNTDFAKYILRKWEKNNHIHIPHKDIQKKFEYRRNATINWSPDNPDKDPYNRPLI